MSVSTALRAERLVAKRYEERGYTVIVEPSQSAIPFDLGTYRPGILATKGTECLLIDVKGPGARVNKNIYRELSRKVEEHPGWRFLLVTLSQNELNQPDAATSTNPTAAALRERLGKLDQLHGATESDGLLLPLYWGAYTAALRLLVGQEGNDLGTITDFSLINKAYSDGIVSFEDYEAAKRLLALRNLAVHSVESVVPDADCLELRQLIARLMDKLPLIGH
jgi:hypothetical protein